MRLYCAISFVLFLFSTGVANAARFTSTHTIDNPTPEDNDYFGWATDVLGGTGIVGGVNDSAGRVNIDAA